MLSADIEKLKCEILETKQIEENVKGEMMNKLEKINNL